MCCDWSALLLRRFTATSSKQSKTSSSQEKETKRRVNRAARHQTRNRGRIEPRILPLHHHPEYTSTRYNIMLLPRRARPGLPFKTTRYPLASTASLPSSSSSPRSPSCRCGCRNSSLCSCACCVHPASSASLTQSARTYTSPSSSSSSSSASRPLPSSSHSCCSSSSTTTTTTTKSFSTTTPTPTAAMEYKLKPLSSLADIPNMEKVEAEVDGIDGGKVLVVRLNDQVHALSPRCTHYGAPLKLGVVAPDGRLTCPWHGGISPWFLCVG